MAYEPKEWVCGETITADGLNNLEEGIQEALECCGGGAGYECSTTSQEIVNENVTTYSTPASYCQGNLSYTDLIDTDTITVTFDGQEYELSKYFDGQTNLYGGQSRGDFSLNPFVIGSEDSGYGIYNMLYTPTAGTYSVVVVKDSISIDSVSSCFAKAVETVTPEVESDVFVAKFIRSGNTITPYAPTTYSDLIDAYRKDKILLGELHLAGSSDKITGLLTSIEDEYGASNFRFGFFSGSVGSVVEYIDVFLRYDNTVQSQTKALAWAQ